MKEFDKIYVAKYSDILTIWQIGEDLGEKTQKVEQVLDELKTIGLYNVYKNMSDYEWEKLENKTDSEILSTYMPKIPGYYLKIFDKIVAEFKEDLTEEIHRFEIYKTEENSFYFDYFCEEDFEGEEWKQIGKLNYEISNYGRIKNTQTKKLKTLKKQRFGMQVLLWQNSQSYTVTISRMVANMFIRKVGPDERVSHINGNIRDNYYKNLRIVSK